ncbi:hypothetical protein WR25_05318 isoform C [Diploscapter pachys]|uniref:Protein kinase domain-containing protein n=1 Tax=Diploscapter pachys TaxID=2018661 RepID=A0A2A2JBR1_9BILA|nr:hypothetical protein WR25_05318 isoform B [Diploscapter pachys]PAV59219.1 hypothetical protein WR25_05318 isoform C [Diploscapter pachys]
MINRVCLSFLWTILISLFSAALILRQLVLVVQYLHKVNVVHRDLSTGNILISRVDNDKIREIKVCDFGLATHLAQHEVAKTIVGTPGYIAPQVRDGSYDRNADIYSLGGVLFHMLSGAEPPKSGSLSVPRHVSESGRRLIERMMEPQPELRIPLDRISSDPFIINNNPGDALNSTSRDSRSTAYVSEPQRAPYLQQPNSFGQMPYQRQPAITRRVSAPNLRANPGPLQDFAPTSRTRPTGSSHGSKFDSGFTDAQPPAAKFVRSIEQEKENWPLKLTRLGNNTAVLKTSRVFVENDSRAIMEIASSKGVVTDIMIVTIRYGVQTVTLYKPVQNNVQKANDSTTPRVEIGQSGMRYKNFSDLERRLQQHYDNLYKCVENFRLSTVKIVYRRPPQFPLSEAKLMENGDVRVALRSEVLVRKFLTKDVIRIVEQQKSRVNDRETIQQMNEVFERLLQIESAWEISVGEFPFYFGFNVAKGLGQSNTSSMMQFSMMNVPQTSRRPLSMLPPTSARSAPPTMALGTRALSSANSSTTAKGLTIQWRRDRNGKIESARLSDGSQSLRLASSEPGVFVYNKIGQKEKRFKESNVPPEAVSLFNRFVQRIQSDAK